METKPFRTLVVVPGSHTDGTFKRLYGEGNNRGKVACKDSSVARRAVQLDLRPHRDSEHESVLVAWDSRVVHQGHTHHPSAASQPGWDPPIHRPVLFRLEESQAWKQWMADKGYVAVTDLLSSADVTEALSELLSDLRLLCPGLTSLEAVRESHLPRSSAANDLRTGSGLCHGKFAWYLRSHPRVAKFFEALFDVNEGDTLIGSVDVLALSPSGSTRPAAGKQWLHLDYSPPAGLLYQATLQLFPKPGADGCSWERIAIMVCKAPTAMASPGVQRSLLAACLAGVASRATAGVTLGLLHSDSKDPPLVGARRLLPALVGEPIDAAEGPPPPDASDGAQLRWLTASQILQCVSLHTLRGMLPQRVLQHVAPTVTLTLAYDDTTDNMASARAMVQQNCQLFALKGKKRGRPFSMAPTPQPSTQTLIPPAKRQLVKPDGRHLSEQGVDTQQRRPLSASQGLAASLRGLHSSRAKQQTLLEETHAKSGQVPFKVEKVVEHLSLLASSKRSELLKGEWFTKAQKKCIDDHWKKIRSRSSADDLCPKQGMHTSEQEVQVLKDLKAWTNRWNKEKREHDRAQAQAQKQQAKAIKEAEKRRSERKRRERVERVKRDNEEKAERRKRYRWMVHPDRTTQELMAGYPAAHAGVDKGRHKSVLATVMGR